MFLTEFAPTEVASTAQTQGRRDDDYQFGVASAGVGGSGTLGG
jgi:hypothetical protein